MARESPPGWCARAVRVRSSDVLVLVLVRVRVRVLVLVLVLALTFDLVLDRDDTERVLGLLYHNPAQSQQRRTLGARDCVTASTAGRADTDRSNIAETACRVAEKHHRAIYGSDILALWSPDGGFFFAGGACI